MKVQNNAAHTELHWKPDFHKRIVKRAVYKTWNGNDFSGATCGNEKTSQQRENNVGVDREYVLFS